MSLLVASISGPAVWMVSDTAITAGKIELRDRAYLPKIEPCQNRKALAGYAGDPDIGLKCLRLAAAKQTFEEAIEVLVEGSKDSETEFAYACFKGEEPKLFRIRRGEKEETRTLHLGVHDAFRVLQGIRLGQISPYAPLALKTFMSGARTEVPEGLAKTVRSMIEVFASREEHDVGGWPVAYFVTNAGTFFCSYAYGVSDPLFDKLQPGSVIPHGTAERGGATLSVTEIGSSEGMAIYWLQNASGRVLMRSSDGYNVTVLHGSPTLFKQLAQVALGRPVDLWVGDQPVGPVKALTIMRGKDGNIDSVIADHGEALSISVHNLATPFQFSAEISMSGISSKLEKVLVGVSTDKSEMSLKIADEPLINLNAEEADRLILAIAQARSELSQAVSADFPQSAKVPAQIDPRWYTNQAPHPSLPGVLLRLRHSGLGWLAFLLPPHEARALGQWLTNNAGEEKQ